MLYPVFLDLTHKKCLVVGAGKVALRKTESLIEAGGTVAVIAPDFDPGFDALEQTGRFERICSEYSPECLDGIDLVIAATNDRDLNGRIYRDTRDRAILINVVDEPENCDFQVPATVRRGDVVIAVSTSGKAPILARRIREELEDLYPEGFNELASIISTARESIKKTGKDAAERGVALAKVVDLELLRLVRSGEFDKIRERIKNCIS